MRDFLDPDPQGGCGSGSMKKLPKFAKNAGKIINLKLISSNQKVKSVVVQNAGLQQPSGASLFLWR